MGWQIKAYQQSLTITVHQAQLSKCIAKSQAGSRLLHDQIMNWCTICVLTLESISVDLGWEVAWLRAKGSEA